MRTKTVILFGMLFLSFFSFAENLTKESATGNDFQLQKLDFDMTFNKTELPTYMITYPGTMVPVFVGVVKKGERTHYIVHRGTLEVQYTAKPGFFGVKRIEKKYATSTRSVINKQLNQEEFSHQRTISHEHFSPEEGLKIIASYFPVLVK